MIDVTKGYKAFEPGLICRGKHYAENTTFEEEGGKLCGAGMMHYCTNPLDCLDYYPLINDNGDLNDFTTVTAEEPPVGDGKKYATKKLHIGAKLDLKGFIKAAVNFLWETSEHDSMTASAGQKAQLAASGDSAKLAASGEDSIVAGIGNDNIGKAALGCWLVLAEWAYSEEKRHYVPTCVKAAQVDGEKLKPDTYYKIQNGEFTEVNNG